MSTYRGFDFRSARAEPAQLAALRRRYPGLTRPSFCVRENRHRDCDGRAWGWVDNDAGREVALWTGEDERKRAGEDVRAANVLLRAAEVDDERAERAREEG